MKRTTTGIRKKSTDEGPLRHQRAARRSADREPFREAAAYLVARVERREMIGVLGATTLTTIYYLVSKASGKDLARETIRRLIGLFEIAPVDHRVLAKAAASAIDDFEDAVLHEAGIFSTVDAVVTRDPQGFSGGSLLVFSPQRLLET
jgi:hypothetical protein